MGICHKGDQGSQKAVGPKEYVSKVSVTYSNGCLRCLDIVTLWNHISRFELCKEKKKQIFQTN